MRNVACGLACSFAIVLVLWHGAAHPVAQGAQAAPPAPAAGAHATYLWPWIAPASPPAVDDGYTLTWDSGRLDPNGLPLNPDWTPKSGERPPIIPSCMHPSASASSTCDSVAGADRATGLKLLTCRVAGSPFPGHVNWSPATVTGVVSWGNLADDDDDNLFFEPAGGAGLTSANHTIDDDAAHPYIELEFSSLETLERLSTSSWTALQAAIYRWATEPIDSSEIDAVLNVKHPGYPSRAVVTGLFGLDCEHGCPSEVHPVYGLAVETNDSPDDNTWILFARNWGNEGFCSRMIHFADTTHLAMALPPLSAGEPTLVSTEWAASDANTPAPTLTLQNDRSIAVNFTLPAPADAGLVELVLHLKWAGGQERVPQAAPTRGRPRAPFTRTQRNRGEQPDIEHYRASLAPPTAPSGPRTARSAATVRAERMATLKTTRRAAVIAMSRGQFVPERSPVRAQPAAPLLASPTLRRLQTLGDADDQRLFQAACRASGNRLPGMSSADSAALCQRAIR